MESVDAIDRYIGATRFNLQDRVLHALYEDHYFPPIRAVADHFGVPLRPRVCYSPSRKAEQVTMGSERWLVYDQYMGQSMNLLNRILLEADGVEAAIAYFHKVLAEQLVDRGALEEALFCARVYDSERSRLRSKRVNEPLRSLYTEVQERFYLFHELGHQVFALDRPDLTYIREEVDDLIASKTADSGLSGSADELIDRFRLGPPEARHDQPLETLEEEVRAYFDGDDAARYRAAYERAIGHRDMREELFCDIFAADLTSGFLPDQQRASDVLRAIYAGFYHLQVLAYVERAFSPDDRGDQAWEDQFAFIQVRSHCLRRHLILPLYAGLTESEKVDAERISTGARQFSLQLMKDQKRYYDVIFDPAHMVVSHLNEPGRLSGLGRTDVAHLIAGTDFEGKQDSEAFKLALDLSVRLMTGWPPRHLMDDAGLVATLAARLRSGKV